MSIILRLTMAFLLSISVSMAATAQEDAPLATIGIAKLIVDDLAETQQFYQSLFGLQEVMRIDHDLDTYEETILSFGSGTTLALLAPNDKVEKPLTKSRFPVVLIYTPEFEAILERLDTMDVSYSIVPTGASGPKVVIARDPSGNAVEIYGTSGEYAVGGSKLIVDDRKKAEAFYQRVFNARSGQLFASAGVYDEVLMNFTEGGTWLALFQPLAEKPLSKSAFPSSTFFTSQMDEVKRRLDQEAYGYYTVETPDDSLNIIIAKDPAGNAIEVIAR
ncbi:MAG: VOC family protein [Pseudohongiellaceae bacterium]|nr:VOC family protein [Pseudohongiellaceae bacterium]